MHRGDLVVDMDRLYEAVSMLHVYDKPNNLFGNVIGIHNLLIDNIKTRYGKWNDAWVIGGYADRYKREKLAEDLGADIEEPKRQLVEGLIQDAAFLFAENHVLKEAISQTGMIKVHPQHPDIQKPIETAKQYLRNINSYAVIVKMSTRDFLEKVIWLLYLNYNAFIYPVYNLVTDTRGGVNRYYTAFYPLNPVQVEFLQDESNTLFVRFYFFNGSNYTLPYADVIHLRKKYSINDIMGGGISGHPDNAALLKVLETNDIVLQGIGKAIKTTLSVRGILKINTLMDDEKQKAERLRFEKAIDDGVTGILRQI